jgi:hypothetical protein
LGFDILLSFLFSAVRAVAFVTEEQLRYLNGTRQAA